MSKVSFKLTVNALVATAIATTGIIAPHVAQANPDKAEAKPAKQTIAQGSLCRAAKLSTPIFEADSTLSPALLLLSPNQQVFLVEIPYPGSPFARVNSPVNGYVQTPVLKTCGGPTPPPPTACRYLKQPSMVNVRTVPRIIDYPSNVIGQVYQGQRVSVILNPDGQVKTAQADGYNWVAIDPTKAPLFLPPGTAWIFNGVMGSSESNLGYCY